MCDSMQLQLDVQVLLRSYSIENRKRDGTEAININTYRCFFKFLRWDNSVKQLSFLGIKLKWKCKLDVVILNMLNSICGGLVKINNVFFLIASAVA